MRAIIIGAGRGQRLRPLTDDSHKSFTEIQGKRILDWILEAFAGAGIDDVCFIEGFNGHVVRETYPQFTFRRNGDWANNNILVSLMVSVRSGRGMGPVKRISHVEARPHKVLSFCW